jgi:hypothetical protein
MGLRRALLITFALLLVAAPAAHAARRMEVAISDEDAMVNGSAGNALQAYQTAQSLNATRMRILVQWSRVSDALQSSPSASPDYNWGPIDNAVDAAAVYGMRTQLDLTGPAPNYGAGVYKGLRILKPSPSLYADFVKAAAEHFKGRVDRYSIWNEPNYPAWIAPQSQSPKIYRALYTAGYAAVKSVDPRAQVLIGETVPYGGRQKGKTLGLATPPLAWLRGVACVNARYHRIGGCTPLKADGYAHHPYEFTTAPTTRSFPGADNAPIQTLGRLRTALKKLARAHALSTSSGRPLDIYLTESGYFVTGRRRIAAPKRARWLPEQFQVAARQPGVREMLQYNVFVPTTTTFTTGLFTLAGAPLPEYKTLLGWTQGAAKKGLIKRNTGPIVLPPRPGGTTVSGSGSGTGSGSGSGSAPGGAGGGGNPSGDGGGSTGSGSSTGSGGGTSSGGGSAAPPAAGGGGSTTTPSPPAPSCQVMIGTICVVP